jgi:hypothetical protein
MIGDQADLLGRLKSLLPAGWFAPAGATSGTSASPTPVLDAILSGFAAVGSWGHALLRYASAQTRMATAGDGWLDIASLDYLGATLPRQPGEGDAAFRARILAAVLPHANTRAAIAAAIGNVTGALPRLVEPWNPADNGVLDGIPVSTDGWDQLGFAFEQPGLSWDMGLGNTGGLYLDVDTAASPARITDPSLCYQGFVDLRLPTVALLGGNPVPCLDGGGLFLDIAGSSVCDLTSSVPPGLGLVLAAINRVKVAGTVLWVRQALPPAALTPAPPFIDDGLYIDTAGSASDRLR